MIHETQLTDTAFGRSHMFKTIKAALLRVWLQVPFGTICSFQYGKQTVTLRKDMWLILSDGTSQDALPLTFVSPLLVAAVEAEMLRIGYRASTAPRRARA